MFELSNITDHPTNPRMIVFFFHQTIHADFFRQLLTKENIPFEEQTDIAGDNRIYFGITKQYEKRARHLNFLTIGKFRKPFIADPILRWIIIGISMIVLGLAIAGGLRAFLHS